MEWWGIPVGRQILLQAFSHSNTPGLQHPTKNLHAKWRSDKTRRIDFSAHDPRMDCIRKHRHGNQHCCFNACCNNKKHHRSWEWCAHEQFGSGSNEILGHASFKGGYPRDWSRHLREAVWRKNLSRYRRTLCCTHAILGYGIEIGTVISTSIEILLGTRSQVEQRYVTLKNVEWFHAKIHWPRTYESCTKGIAAERLVIYLLYSLFKCSNERCSHHKIKKCFQCQCSNYKWCQFQWHHPPRSKASNKDLRCSDEHKTIRIHIFQWHHEDVP